MYIASRDHDDEILPIMSAKTGQVSYSSTVPQANLVARHGIAHMGTVIGQRNDGSSTVIGRPSSLQIACLRTSCPYITKLHARI